MAGYFDQIPRQLAARRKARAAAIADPALRSGYHDVVLSIAANIFDFLITLTVNGSVSPVGPLRFGIEESAFLNFGATPALLRKDRMAMEAKGAGRALMNAETLSPEGEEAFQKSLASLAAAYGDDQSSTRVYNLEPWLQDMYRDRLGFDHDENLRERKSAVLAAMKNFPRKVFATGLAPAMASGVLDAFRLFASITAASHQLTREKMSITDRRSYVDTVNKIVFLMNKADESLGVGRSRGSAVRKLYEMWKECNYEILLVNRQLRKTWTGTDLDDRIREMLDLFRAVLSTLKRCPGIGESPQLPLLPADMDFSAIPDRAAAVGAFRRISRFDFIAGDDGAARAREIRRYGPLVLLIAPGSGQPRYCWEMRRLPFVRPSEEPQTAKREGEYDLLRRVNYPLNVLVLPLGADRSRLDVDMADAWLEYCQTAFPHQYNEVLEKCRSLAPALFEAPEGTAPAGIAIRRRNALARLAAAFATWAESGTETENMPEFRPFRNAVLTRLHRDGILYPPRHRPLLELFAEAGEGRRTGLWRYFLGKRFDLDRQLVAADSMLRDWRSLREHLILLPNAVQNSPLLASAFAKLEQETDAFSAHRAAEAFRRFLLGHADLAMAVKTVENQLAGEMETLRRHTESLGKELIREEAAAIILRRMVSRIQKKRMAANKHIDSYLIGLMHALDGNFRAAEPALASCLSSRGKDASASSRLSSPPSGAMDETAFNAIMRHSEEQFPPHSIPGRRGGETKENDFLHYNLGIVYMRLNQGIEARMSFTVAKDDASGGTPYLCRLWAEEQLRILDEEERCAGE